MNKDWSLVPLGEVVTPTERPDVPTPGTTYRQIGVKLWGEGAYERESMDGAQTKYAQLFRAEAGDIIVNKIWARNGSVAVVPDALAGCYGSGEFPMFAPNRERLDPRWMHWITKTRGFWTQCDEKSRGTSGKNRIKPEQFLCVEIPLPPLEEQRRVVAQIERLAAQIREARALRVQAMEEARALWARRAADVFDALAVMYPVRPLADVVEIRGGGTPSKDDPLYWNGGIPWISPKDMKYRDIEDSIDHISARATVETAARLVEAGSVLVVVRGMILAHTLPAAVLRVPAAINQDMKALVPMKELLPEFLVAMFWAYNSRLLEMVEKSTHDTRKLETAKLLNTKIVLPPITEQRRIMSVLDELGGDLDSLMRLQTETAIELQALLPSILHCAFQGRL